MHAYVLLLLATPLTLPLGPMWRALFCASCAAPLRCRRRQAVALDPRYGGRKTRELVYGTAAGSLMLSSKVGGQRSTARYCCSERIPAALWGAMPSAACSASRHTCLPGLQGWLGAKETPLFTGRGPVHCARMAGTLLAWATDSGLRCACRLLLPLPAALSREPAIAPAYLPACHSALHVMSTCPSVWELLLMLSLVQLCVCVCYPKP